MERLEDLARDVAGGLALSERAFWAFWRKGDQPSELFITWFAYSLIVAFALSVARMGRVKDRHQVFLVGALVGWMAEGVLVQTALGSGDNPFPLSISWTGLAWHSLLTVVGGAWVLPRLASEPLRLRTVGKLIGIGMGYGLWANYYFLEKGESIHSLGSFATHTLFIWALLVPGIWLMGHPFPASSPTRGDRIVVGMVGLLAGGVFIAAALLPQPLFAGILAACFGVTLGALLRPRQEPPTMVPTPSKVAWQGALAVGTIPLVTTGLLVAATFRFGGWTLPTNILLYVLTMPTGFWWLGRAWWLAYRSPKSESSSKLAA